MSDHTGPYDPNAIEGEKPAGSQYIQLKDLRTWAIALALLSVPMYLIYTVMKGDSERSRCQANLSEMYKAINLYAGEHDNRYPPIGRTLGDGFSPDLAESGMPYTWASDVAPLMNTRHTMVCPTATEAETVRNESGESLQKVVNTTYGMYAPYGGVLTQLVESPDEVVLIAETSNLGAKDTVDPVPFDKGAPDGFVIGWSNSNKVPDDKTQSVTRLAFPGGTKGKHDEGRHGKFLQALSASGQLLRLFPGDSAYNSGGGVNPHWRLPPGYRGPGG